MDETVISRTFCSPFLRRWTVLLVVGFLTASNALLWLSYSSVANFAAKQLNQSEKLIDYLLLVFCIATVVTGLLVVWLVDKMGLRFAILVGAWLNCLGAVVRVLDRLWDNYIVAMTGQSIAALAQPFLYCIPTKVAEQWFPDNQRVLATSFAVMANLVGQLIACGVTPQFVTDMSADSFHNMNLYYGIPCFVGAVGATILIQSSKPESPPSCSAAISTNYPYFFALRTFLKRKDSILLLFAVGSVLGISYTLTSRMQEILCVQGYDDVTSGQCSMIHLGCGLLGAVLSSIIAQQGRKFIPIIKISLALMVVSFCFFIIIVRYGDQKALIQTACGLVGFWGYAAFPVGLELAVEHSFTVLPEATSTGLILIAGHILSIIYFIFFETITTEQNFPHAMCNNNKSYRNFLLLSGTEIKPQDTKWPLISVAIIATSLVSLFIYFFKCDYNRMKTENRSMSAIVNDDDPIVSSTSYDDMAWHTSIYS